MTSRDWQPTHQRLPYRAGIVAAPTPNPAGPRRRDDEPMMKPRRRTRIDCDRVSRNGVTGVEFNCKAATQEASHITLYRQLRVKDLPKVPTLAARVGFEPATLQMQGTELTTEPQRPR